MKARIPRIPTAITRSHNRKICATRPLVRGCLSRKTCTAPTTKPRTKKNKATNFDPFLSSYLLRPYVLFFMYEQQYMSKMHYFWQEKRAYRGQIAFIHSIAEKGNSRKPRALKRPELWCS